MIIAKMQIYYCKFSESDPNINGFIGRVTNIENVEKYIATKNNKDKIHNDKWFIIQNNDP